MGLRDVREERYQTSLNSETRTKKAIGLRTLLNIVGVFIFLGLLLTIVTVPYTIENFEIHKIELEKLKLDPKNLKDFLSVIFGAAFLYFYLTNIYFMGELGRKIFFLSLTFLSIVNLFIIFWLL